MLFLWVILYGLVYGGAAGKGKWTLPLAMVVYTAAFLLWIWKAGYWEQIGLTKRQKPAVRMLPLLILPLGNGILYSFSFAGWETGVLLLCTSVIEELFFRGFLLSCFLEKGTGKAVVGTSLLFALMHLVNLESGAPFAYTLLQVMCAFWVSISYCLVILRWNSLWPCIAAHMLTNLTASGDVLPDHWLPVTLVCILLCVLYSFWLYSDYLKQKKEIVP